MIAQALCFSRGAAEEVLCTRKVLWSPHGDLFEEGKGEKKGACEGVERGRGAAESVWLKHYNVHQTS